MKKNLTHFRDGAVVLYKRGRSNKSYMDDFDDLAGFDGGGEWRGGVRLLSVIVNGN